MGICPMCHSTNVKYKKMGNVGMFVCKNKDCKHVWTYVLGN